MRILIVTDRCFMKPQDGSAMIYKAWLNNLHLLGHQVSVLSFNHPRTRWDNASVNLLKQTSDKVLIADVYPNIAVGMVHSFLTMAWTLLTGRRYPPRWFDNFLSRKRHATIEEFLAREMYDAIVVNKVRSMFLMGHANVASSRAIKVLDIHDNFAERAAKTRMVALRMLKRRPKLIFQRTIIRDLGNIIYFTGKDSLLREEVHFIQPFDRVLFCSDDEATTYVDAGLPRNRVLQAPWTFADGGSHVISSDAPAARRPYDIGFIAAGVLFNIEAIIYFAEEILPRLKAQKPDIRLLVVGSICSTALEFFAGDPSVTLIPRIENIEDFYKSIEVVVIPLLSGTGVSIKAMEAAWMSSAIVSTSVGIRGLYLREGADYLLAEDAEKFAASVVHLLADPDQRRALRLSASQEIRKRHSAEAFASTTADIFERPSAEPIAACP